MARMTPHKFTKWEMDDMETLRSSIFNSENKMWLQNQQSILAEQLLAIKIDPTNPLAAMADQAHLQGQLEFCGWLLATSDEAEKLLMEEIRQNHQQS